MKKEIKIRFTRIYLRIAIGLFSFTILLCFGEMITKLVELAKAITAFQFDEALTTFLTSLFLFCGTYLCGVAIYLIINFKKLTK